MFPCYIITVLHCNIIVLQCFRVTLFPCYIVSVLHCYIMFHVKHYVTLLHCFLQFLLPCKTKGEGRYRISRGICGILTYVTMLHISGGVSPAGFVEFWPLLQCYIFLVVSPAGFLTFLGCKVLAGNFSLAIPTLDFWCFFTGVFSPWNCRNWWKNALFCGFAGFFRGFMRQKRGFPGEYCGFPWYVLSCRYGGS